MENLLKILSKVPGVTDAYFNPSFGVFHFTFESRSCIIAPKLVSNAVKTLGLEGAIEELRDMFSACVTQAPDDGEIVFSD